MMWFAKKCPCLKKYVLTKSTVRVYIMEISHAFLRTVISLLVCNIHYLWYTVIHSTFSV